MSKSDLPVREAETTGRRDGLYRSRGICQEVHYILWWGGRGLLDVVVGVVLLMKNSGVVVGGTVRRNKNLAGRTKASALRCKTRLGGDLQSEQSAAKMRVSLGRSLLPASP